MGKCMGLMLQLKGVIKGVKNLLSVELQTGKKSDIDIEDEIKLCVWVGKGHYYGGGARREQAKLPQGYSSSVNIKTLTYIPIIS